MRINLQIKNIQLLGAVTGSWQTTKRSKFVVGENFILLNYMYFKTPQHRKLRGWFQLAYSRVFISKFMCSE
jgi:hypothetical protein